MKAVLIVASILCAYYVYVLGENCNQATDCLATKCSNASLATVGCVNGDCTCVPKPKPCITKGDCSNATCFKDSGDQATYHCYDNYCKCMD